MEPNFNHGEYLIVEEFSYNFNNPQRGDVVVFRHPEPDCDDHINSNYINRKFFQGACNNYIKRVVGLPGETISIRDGKVSIREKDSTESEILSEDYIPANIPTLGNQTVVLGKDEFFVLGDNRNPNASSDSREWGALPKTHIVGRALVVLLPPQEFGVVERIEY